MYGALVSLVLHDRRGRRRCPGRTERQEADTKSRDGALNGLDSVTTDIRRLVSSSSSAGERTAVSRSLRTSYTAVNGAKPTESCLFLCVLVQITPAIPHVTFSSWKRIFLEAEIAFEGCSRCGSLVSPSDGKPQFYLLRLWPYRTPLGPPFSSFGQAEFYPNCTWFEFADGSKIGDNYCDSSKPQR